MLFRHTAKPVTTYCIVAILFLVAAGMPFDADYAAGQQVTPQVFQVLNAGAQSLATILGAADGDHISSNGTAGDFSPISRARALATGDLNGDSIPDVVIGAPNAGVAFPPDPDLVSNTGVVYIVFGAPGLSGTIDTATGGATLKITGPAQLAGSAAPANFGFSVAVGDVNGDGTPDLVVGAPGHDFPGAAPASPRPDTGAAYVFQGGAGLSALEAIGVDAASHVIFGVASSDRFGASVAVGNVGGLSTSPPAEQAAQDILVGAPDHDAPARADGGAGYVVFGGSGLNPVGGQPGMTDLNATPANVIVLGRDGDQLGSSAAVGDVNGGNLGDLLLGGPLVDRPALPSAALSAAADTGAIIGVFGGTNLTPAVGNSKTFDTNINQQNLSIYGGATGDRLGVSIAAGDVTGDGVPDILAGAPDASTLSVGARPNAGEAYVFRGGTNLNPITGSEARLDVALNDFSLRVLGGSPGDRLGMTVAAGSFNTIGNSDNISDFLIGIPGLDSRRGGVSVILGGATLTAVANRDFFLGQDDVRVLGAQTGNLTGRGLRIRQTLTTEDTTVQPTFEILVAAVNPAGGDFPVTEDTDTEFTTGASLSGATVRGTGPAARLELQNNPALQFDGSDDFVQVANSSSLRPGAGNWTVEFWLSRPAAGTGDFEPIISSRPFTATTALGWTVGVDPATGKIGLLMGDGTQGFIATSTSAVSATLDHWSIAFDRAGSKVFFFKNGALDATVAIAAGNLPGAISQADPVFVGSDASPGTRFLNGTLDDIRVWNIARSQPQIAGDFKKELVGTEAGLVAYWKLNESSGSTAFDSTASGNTTGNPGTINGATRTTTPTRFVTFGQRVSRAYAFAAGQFVSSQIDWTLTVPTETTLTVETSVDNGITWQVAQSSRPIPNLSLGDELGWAIAAADVNGNGGGDLIVGAPFAFSSVDEGPRPQAGAVYVLPSQVTPPFNQPPTTTLTAPNGGESLQSGKMFNITWTASDPDGEGTIQSFDLLLSTNGGTSFNFIIASGLAGSARQFSWTVPTGLNTTTARVRVIVTDNQGAKGQDESNGNFSITDVGTPVTVLAPNGGETVNPGQDFLIRWEVPPLLRSQIRGFDVFLSQDGGMTFPLRLALGSGDPAEPALGPDVFEFNWRVQSLCTSQARVSVVATSLTNVRTSDASNSDFIVVDPGPTVDVARSMIFTDSARMRLIVGPPPVGGSEILFAPDPTIEISSDGAGTQFFGFSKPPRIKKAGRKAITKGTINDQSLLDFFPNGATRVIRITNPPCGITLIRAQRSGEQLILAPPAETGLHEIRWQ